LLHPSTSRGYPAQSCIHTPVQTGGSVAEQAVDATAARLGRRQQLHETAVGLRGTHVVQEPTPGAFTGLLAQVAVSLERGPRVVDRSAPVALPDRDGPPEPFPVNGDPDRHDGPAVDRAPLGPFGRQSLRPFPGRSERIMEQNRSHQPPLQVVQEQSPDRLVGPLAPDGPALNRNVAQGHRDLRPQRPRPGRCGRGLSGRTGTPIIIRQSPRPARVEGA
jgi:hypothetical protein